MLVLKNAVILIIIIIAIIVLYSCEREIIKGGSNIKKYYIIPSNIDPNFDNKTETILNKSGWNKKYKLIRVYDDNESDFNIMLCGDDELELYHKDKKYHKNGDEIRFSITVQSKIKKPRVYINAKNWLEGTTQSNLTLPDYQTYVINHEVGHALGYDHLPCDEKTISNNTCPVMYQSTRGHDVYQPGHLVQINDYDAPRIFS